MIFCALIFFSIAVLSGVALFSGFGSRNFAVEVLFTLSVASFLGTLVTLLSRRAAAYFRDHDPPIQQK